VASHQYIIWASRSLAASFFLSFSRVTSEQNLLGERERESLWNTQILENRHKHEHILSHTDTNKENPLDTETQTQNLDPEKKGACLKSLDIHPIHSSSSPLRKKKEWEIERRERDLVLLHLPLCGGQGNLQSHEIHNFFLSRNSRIFSLTLGIELPFSAFDRYLQLPRYPIKSLSLSPLFYFPNLKFCFFLNVFE